MLDVAGAWHPEDLLLVLMRGSDGEVNGILSVDEPVSGLRPSDEILSREIAGGLSPLDQRNNSLVGGGGV